MLPLIKNGESVYAGFWQRFGAHWIDFIIALPLLAALTVLHNLGKQAYIISSVAQYSLFSWYAIYFHARWGGTLGKMAIGIRITRLDGTRIGYREALKRSSVEMAFGALSWIAIWIALTRITDAEFDAVGWRQRSRHIATLMPQWNTPLRVVSYLWVSSEFVVLLFNKRRRAIHDFIAGTVVLKKGYVKIK